MKIKSITQKGNKLKIFTDNPDRPEFAYPADKFATLSQLEAEMGRSYKASIKRTEAEVLRKMQMDSDIKEAMIKYDKEPKDDKQ